FDQLLHRPRQPVELPYDQCVAAAREFERVMRGRAVGNRARHLLGENFCAPCFGQCDIEAAKAMLANPDIGVTQIAHRLGVSPATLYRYTPAARTANSPGV